MNGMTVISSAMITVIHSSCLDILKLDFVTNANGNRAKNPMETLLAAVHTGPISSSANLMAAKADAQISAVRINRLMSMPPALVICFMRKGFLVY
jgi:hypothetical protein